MRPRVARDRLRPARGVVAGRGRRCGPLHRFPPRRDVVRRPRGGLGHRLRPLQRDVGRVLLQRGGGVGRGPLRLRQRRRPRHLSAAGADARSRPDARRRAVSAASGAAPDRPPLPQRPGGRRGRCPHPALHRRDRGQRSRRRLLRHGRGRRRRRQRRLDRPLPHAAGAQPALSEQRRRHLHGCECGHRRRRPPLGRGRLVRRRRPRRLARPLRRQLRRLRARRRRPVPDGDRRAELLRAEELSLSAGSPLQEPWRRHVRRRDGGSGHRRGVRPGPRGGRRRPERGRPGRHLRGQRRRAQPVVDQRGGGGASATTRCSPAWPSTPSGRPRRAWASTWAMWTSTATATCS